MSDNEAIAPLEGWIAVYSHPRAGPVSEAAFVLTALGIEHDVLRDDRQWQLWTAAEHAHRAGSELALYWRENAVVASRTPDAPAIDSGLLGVLGFLLVIWGVPWLQSWTLTDWHGAGAMLGVQALDNQWWRTITALTLHADLGHIFGNSAFGALFGLLAGRQLGSGIAWLLTALAAALANGINAWVQPDNFQSIGASTATFAALGILAAVIWRRGYYRSDDWRRSLAPVFAVIALFSFTGVGGERTDILAHLFGALCGFAIGLLAARLPLSWLGPRAQLGAGGATLALVTLAWVLALGV